VSLMVPNVEHCTKKSKSETKGIDELYATEPRSTSIRSSKKKLMLRAGRIELPTFCASHWSNVKQTS
jgi:hypothetical protein